MSDELEEGCDCPEGCGGAMELATKSCSCHISPPCDSCVEGRLECSGCGFEWSSEDKTPTGNRSDSYDPEWGTSSNAVEIKEAMQEMHDKVSKIVSNVNPMYILDLVRSEFPEPISATLTTKEWRLLRFALEIAKHSI